jgi:hypothetical protein
LILYMSCGTRVQRDVYPGTARGVILEISLKSVIKKKKASGLKKYTVFILFSLFFALKTAVYSAFFHGFFPTASRHVKIIT